MMIGLEMSLGAIILDSYMTLLPVAQKIIKLKSGRIWRKTNGVRKQKSIFKTQPGK